MKLSVRTTLVKRPWPEPRARWHYRQSGQGPNLLLLHGLGASIFSWRHNLEPLGQYFRVMALDLKGCGNSPASVCDDYTLTALVQDVADFMDAWGIERTALAGNSLGGSVALLVTQRCPERVSALILLAPAVMLSRMPYIFYPLRLPVVSWLVALLMGPWIMPWALRLAYHDRRLITPEVIAGYARPLRSLKRRLTLRALCQNLHPWPLDQILALLAAIRQPTTLIWGEEDRILPPVQAHWLQAALPQAELHLLPQVGHAPQEEDPLRVNKIIIDFLQRSS